MSHCYEIAIICAGVFKHRLGKTKLKPEKNHNVKQTTGNMSVINDVSVIVYKCGTLFH